jgi:hypothetical protein
MYVCSRRMNTFKVVQKVDHINCLGRTNRLNRLWKLELERGILVQFTDYIVVQSLLQTLSFTFLSRKSIQYRQPLPCRSRSSLLMFFKHGKVGRIEPPTCSRAAASPRAGAHAPTRATRFNLKACLHKVGFFHVRHGMTRHDTRRDDFVRKNLPYRPSCLVSCRLVSSRAGHEKYRFLV